MFMLRSTVTRACPSSSVLFPFYSTPPINPTRFISRPFSKHPALSLSHRPFVVHFPRTTVLRNYSSSTAPKRSSFVQAFERALNFPPRTWIVAGLILFVYGAGLIIMSTSDFIAYSDEESLKQFQPIEPSQVEIDQYINNHPLTKSLRSKSEFTESRPTLKVKETYRSASLTSGVLAGSGKIEVPPYQWSEDGGKTLVQILYLGSDLCGHPGIVHGGLLATLLDEGLARCCFPALPNKTGMTANLTINYRKPAPASSYVALKAKTVKVEGRKAWVEGHIETLVGEGEERVKLVEASALMIEPRHAAVLKTLMNTP